MSTEIGKIEPDEEDENFCEVVEVENVSGAAKETEKVVSPDDQISNSLTNQPDTQVSELDTKNEPAVMSSAELPVLTDSAIVPNNSEAICPENVSSTGSPDESSAKRADASFTAEADPPKLQEVSKPKIVSLKRIETPSSTKSTEVKAESIAPSGSKTSSQKASKSKDAGFFSDPQPLAQQRLPLIAPLAPIADGVDVPAYTCEETKNLLRGKKIVYLGDSSTHCCVFSNSDIVIIVFLFQFKELPIRIWCCCCRKTGL